ncbi:MAG: hypothetical protein Kow0063_18190 [Anaerolineae bacterium]
MDVDTTLQQAIVAARAGRKEEARRLLEIVLDADERNEQAWLWMSGVVDNDEERIICLENVLTINPNNETARNGLAALGAMPVAGQASQSVFSEQVSEASPVAPPAMSQAGPRTPDVTPDQATYADRRLFIALTVVLALMLICTVISILVYVILSPAG